MMGPCLRWDGINLCMSSKKIFFSTFLISSIFFFTGCATVALPDSGSLKNVAKKMLPPTTVETEKEILPSYVTREKFVDKTTQEEGSVLFIRLDPKVWQWNLAEDFAHPKSVSVWRDQTDSVIAINSTYFTDSDLPSGYYKHLPTVATSTRVWPSEKEMKNLTGYTGAVSVKDGVLHLSYLPKDVVDPKKERALFLTYPTLVADQKALVTKESGLSARRTVLAEDHTGLQYIVVFPDIGISLYELAQYLAARPEGFVKAVNLDGGPSTGISVKDGDAALDMSIAQVPMAIVLKRR